MQLLLTRSFASIALCEHEDCLSSVYKPMTYCKS